MSVEVHCNVCDRDFQTTEKFVEHFESRFDHYQATHTLNTLARVRQVLAHEKAHLISRQEAVRLVHEATAR